MYNTTVIRVWRKLLSACCRSKASAYSHLVPRSGCRAQRRIEQKTIFPGVAQLVGRLVWELEHQNGPTSRNVAYSPFTSQIPLITPVESWAKPW